MRTSAHIPHAKRVSGIAVGDHAYVFFQRLMEICDSGKYPQEIVLGPLMAHELGHVLLGQNSHSREGIMSGRVSPGELQLALNGLLFFDAKQTAKLRNRLATPVTARRRTMRRYPKPGMVAGEAGQREVP